MRSYKLKKPYTFNIPVTPNPGKGSPPKPLRKPSDGLLDKDGLASYLGVHISTVDRLLADGLTRVDVRGAVRFKLDEVLEWLENHGQPCPLPLGNPLEETLTGCDLPTRKQKSASSRAQGKPTLSQLCRELGKSTSKL